MHRYFYPPQYMRIRILAKSNYIYLLSQLVIGEEGKLENLILSGEIYSNRYSSAVSKLHVYICIITSCATEMLKRTRLAEARL